MNDQRQCSQCGASIPDSSPQGFCPSCLLKWGLESQTGGHEGENPSTAAGYTPPTPSEIAAHFPDLEVLELVGRGGMGVVYKARQKRLDRLVALKILAPKIGQEPAFAKRFAREARAMAMLNHPNIVAVHDFGQTEVAGSERHVTGTSSPLPPGEGKGKDLSSNPQSLIPNPSPLPNPAPFYYFIMEFVDGLNLRRLLDTGKLSSKEALAIVPQICEALQYAHDHGVVHRDIKPENILVDKEGRVKIADFGIAKLVGGKVASEDDSIAELATRRSPLATNLTAAGQIIGTPQYMAPEQVLAPQSVDHRADIYALGVVFYQMLTGELPKDRFVPPSQKVQIDVRLDEVVLRALEKEPERRYQQANELKTHVETIVTVPLAHAKHKDAPVARSDDPQASAPYLPPEGRGGATRLWPVAVCSVGALLFLWFILVGHALFQIDLDADVQFWLGVLGLPLVVGVFGIIAWAVQSIRFALAPELNASSSTQSWHWGWREVACLASFLISLPLIGGAAVIVSLLSHERAWNPRTGELMITLSFVGLAILSASATALLAIDIRRMRRRSMPGTDPVAGSPRVAKWLVGVFMLCLAAFWTISSNDIWAVLLHPSMRNILQWDHFAAIAIALGLLAWGIGILRIKRQNAVRTVLSLLLVSLVFFTAVVLNYLVGIAPTMQSLAEDLPTLHRQAEPENIDIRQHPGGPWIAKLPLGKIELAAVSHHPSKGKPWWRPDGSPSGEGPFDIDGNHCYPSQGQRAFEFVVRPIGLPQGASLPIWEFPQARGSATGGSLKSTGEPEKGYHCVCATYPDAMRFATIRIGTAFDPWETIYKSASIQSFSTATGPRRNGTYWKVIFAEPVEKSDGSIVFTGTYSKVDQETRLTLVDKSGVEHKPVKYSAPSVGEIVQVTAVFQNVSVKKIAEARFQARPYHWVEFRNVALQPEQRVRTKDSDTPRQEPHRCPTAARRCS